MVQNPTTNQIEMSSKMTTTMAVNEYDPTPFKPVPPLKPHKKAKPNPGEVVKVQHKL